MADETRKLLKIFGVAVTDFEAEPEKLEADATQFTADCRTDQVTKLVAPIQGARPCHPAAEPMLALVADQLNETRPLERFWQSRPTRLTGLRSYQAAA